MKLTLGQIPPQRALPWRFQYFNQSYLRVRVQSLLKNIAGKLDWLPGCAFAWPASQIKPDQDAAINSGRQNRRNRGNRKSQRLQTRMGRRP